ncbi:MAG TPA: hypothetical protein VH601_18205 [Bryobacteraceae bacterium]
MHTPTLLTGIQNLCSPQNSAIVAEGLRFGFQTNRGDLAAEFSSAFAPGSVPTEFADLDFVYALEQESRGGLYAAYLESRALVRGASLKDALDSIASDLQHTIASHSRKRLFLHAGVIGWRDRAVLFPGRTWSGKSTLVHALIQAGAVYFSDEFAAIDARGYVHPFARPLCLRSGVGRSAVRPEDEGLKIASSPCRACAIVATEYKMDGVWRPEPLSPGQAALKLLSNTIAVRSDPVKAVRYVGRLVSSATAIASSRGDARVTAPLLLETLDRLLS